MGLYSMGVLLQGVKNPLAEVIPLNRLQSVEPKKQLRPSETATSAYVDKLKKEGKSTFVFVEVAVGRREGLSTAHPHTLEAWLRSRRTFTCGGTP